jgi:thiamine-monophosphate kinase
MARDEFDLIARYLAPLASNAAARGLVDDAAVFEVPAGYHGVVSTDALVSGVHFPAHATGDVVARRALGSALSDLAAMGATPTGCLLTWGIGPDWDESFFAEFAEAFGATLDTYNVDLWGGDTVRATTPFISVCVHGIGRKPDLLSRSRARAGEAVYVSGTIGDGFLGLQAFGTMTDADAVSAYAAPTPQLALGQALTGVASACIDVSDGLAADLDHICRASQIAMEIEASAVPLSAAGVAYAQDTNFLAALLSGGDDYQLAFTVSAENAPKLEDIGRAAQVALTRIGTVTQSPEQSFSARFLAADGAEISFANRGYKHF